jgi:hypothetical protein
MDRRVGDRSKAGAEEFPLPDGAARSLRIASDTGGELTCFSGAGPIDDWIMEFDAMLTAQGWTRSQRWSRADRSAAAAFRRVSEQAAESAAITLLQDETGVWRGIIDLHRD